MTDRRRLGTRVTVLFLRCIECGTRSTGVARGWRAYQIPDPEDTAATPEVAVYCPACAEREFGGGAGSLG